MKVLLISTLGHNPGDEFIRLGIEHVLRQAIEGASFRPIHKQDPRSLFSGFTIRSQTPHRLIGPWLYRFYALTNGWTEENYLETADLIVFAGSPFIWRSDLRFLPSTCANAEWVAATWLRLFREIKDKPVLNLAAGTGAFSQKELEAIRSDRKITNFLKKALSRAELTTSRDEKTQEILRTLGFQTELIPCASLLAAKGAHLQPQTPEYVVINLMPGAAPQGRGHHLNSTRWLSIVSEIIPEIEKRHEVVFVSHFPDEDDTAARYFPGRRRFYSKDPIELLKVYSKALWGLCNRVHSGAAIAAFCRPVISVGGDFRNNLIKQFDLPAFDHRELDAAKLRTVIHAIEGGYEEYVAKVHEKMTFTEQKYLQVLRNTSVCATDQSRKFAYSRQ